MPKPPVKPGKVPYRVSMARGRTRAEAFSASQKYTANTRVKYAGRELDNILGVSFYNGYIAGVKAERERQTGYPWKVKHK